MAHIYVLAGVNGAGKSSVIGRAFTDLGGAFFNPDEATKQLRLKNPALTLADANGAAWNLGRELLERAIAERESFAFETTLGGKTIASLLELALEGGLKVKMQFVGLASPELHLARVRSRVTAGGHDIPEEKIRERYDQSRANLIRLLPKLTELLVYDNSAEADPKTGKMPKPKLLLHWRDGKIVKLAAPNRAPQWAKPILAAALRTAAK
jgi:predicted ABC-type ATPase